MGFWGWNFGDGFLGKDLGLKFWSRDFGDGILELEFGTGIWGLEVWGWNSGIRNFGVGILGLEFWGWDFRIGILENDFRIRILGLEFWGWYFGSMPCRCLGTPPKKSQKFPAPGSPALFDPNPRIILLFQAWNVGFLWNVELSGTGATCRPGSCFVPKKIVGTGPGGGSGIPKKFQNSLEAPEFPGMGWD